MTRRIIPKEKLKRKSYIPVSVCGVHVPAIDPLIGRKIEKIDGEETGNWQKKKRVSVGTDTSSIVCDICTLPATYDLCFMRMAIRSINACLQSQPSSFSDWCLSLLMVLVPYNLFLLLYQGLLIYDSC